MFNEFGATPAAYATALEIPKYMSSYVDFAKEPEITAGYDGSVNLTLHIYGNLEIISGHINPQGQLTDLQCCELNQDGQVVEITNARDNDLWEDLANAEICVNHH